MAGRKFKDGDTVKILKTSYKDEIATVVSHTSGHSGYYSSTKGHYTVKRKNGKTINLYSTEMELISSEEIKEEKKPLKWHVASDEEIRNAIKNNIRVLIRPDLVTGISMCEHTCTPYMAEMRGRTVRIYNKYGGNNIRSLGVREDKGNYTWSPSCFGIEEKDSVSEISVMVWIVSFFFTLLSLSGVFWVLATKLC